MEIPKEDIIEIGRQISENNLKDKSYVVLVYEIHPRWKKVRFAYRNFQEFKNKIEDDYNKKPFDEDNGIYLEWREFD